MAFGSFGCIMSDLLTIREKSILINLLEPQCKHSEEVWWTNELFVRAFTVYSSPGSWCLFSLARSFYQAIKLIKTTVAQILQSKETEGETPSWHRLHCGVVCLVEDKSEHSYVLRLYCVTRAKLLWEEELYVPCKYTASCAYFHTFPTDAHHVGLNFANETEAEEFYSAVKAVYEKMTPMIIVTENEKASSSLSNPPNLQTAKSENVYEQPDTFSTTLTTDSFSGRDAAMISLLLQAKVTEEDLRNKDVAELVDSIISQSGGLKAVQTELRRKSTGSKTIPRAAGVSISATLQEGPLTPIPPIKKAARSQQPSQDTAAPNTSQSDSSESSTPPSPTSGRLRRSASLKDVGSSAAAEGCDPIVVALREAFKQKKMFVQNTSECPDEAEAQTS